MTTATPNLLELLHVSELTEEEQEELLLDIGDLVFKGTMVRVIEKMDDETRDEFNKLLDTDADEEEVDAFIQKHVPQSDEIVEEVIQELTSDILAVTK